MGLTGFVLAVLALLLAPGPTNTLMGVAGAQRGIRHVARLLPAELAGYLTAILPLAFVGAEVVARAPALGTALKLVAAVWILILALRLWRAGAAGGTVGTVGHRRIYVTTALNPKALVFALVLLPAPQDPDFTLRLALFCAMVAGVALLWGWLGVLTQVGRGGPARLTGVQRLASVWLACVALSLVAGVAGVTG
jgi:threonine/homoserine/homoserine lactone efflux protein